MDMKKEISDLRNENMKLKKMLEDPAFKDYIADDLTQLGSAVDYAIHSGRANDTLTDQINDKNVVLPEIVNRPEVYRNELNVNYLIIL